VTDSGKHTDSMNSIMTTLGGGMTSDVKNNDYHKLIGGLEHLLFFPYPLYFSEGLKPPSS
jgi:hypothetical protein